MKLGWGECLPFRRTTPSLCTQTLLPDHFTSEKTSFYSQLSRRRREIRLITLLPGQLSDEIVCNLASCSLTERPKYEALSYVWGTSSQSQYITVNGNSVSVTDNLYISLQFLRRPDEVRILWIDALCINQACVEERNYQVALMGSIYASATRVLCWLGTPNSDGIVRPDGHAMTVEQSLATVWNGPPADRRCLEACISLTSSDDRHGRLKSRFNKLDESAVPRTLAGFALLYLLSKADKGIHATELPFLKNGSPTHSGIAISERYEAAFESFASLVDSAWWDRVWTVQEAVLAKDLWMVHFHIEIPFKMLEHAGLWLDIHGNQCCPLEISNLAEKQRRVLERLRSKTKEIQALRGWARDGSLAKLLYRFRTRQASDPRDKVNALLGLCRKSGEVMKADYSMTTEQTYIKTAMKLIKDSKSLDHLGGLNGSRDYFHLPSWVQDWSVAEEINSNGFRGHLASKELYSAGGKLSKHKLCDSCKSTLIVEGSEVDTIRSVGCVGRLDGDADGDDELCVILKEWESMATDHGSRVNETYRNGQSRSDAFRSTLSGDLVFARQESTSGTGASPPLHYRSGDMRNRRPHGENEESDEDLSRNWWRVITAKPDEMVRSDWISHVMNVVIPVMKNNRFFLTQQGMMGIGPSGISNGDRVFVLHGGGVPFILRGGENQHRKLEACSHPPQLCFQVIGTSYVHGIMSGEALSDKKRVKTKLYCG